MGEPGSLVENLVGVARKDSEVKVVALRRGIEGRVDEACFVWVGEKRGFQGEGWGRTCVWVVGVRLGRLLVEWWRRQ